jgi:hypothetical protein
LDASIEHRNATAREQVSIKFVRTGLLHYVPTDVRQSMRLFKNIAWLTLALWFIQIITSVIFFASFFTHLIVRCFVMLGSPLPESSVEDFLSSVMKVLSWPIRLLFPSAWADATTIKILLLLAVNGLIWGGVLGTILFLIRRNRASSSTPVL